MNQKSSAFFKVVSVDRDRLFSAHRRFINPAYVVEYVPGEIAESKLGYLFAYPDVDRARNFLDCVRTALPKIQLQLWRVDMADPILSEDLEGIPIGNTMYYTYLQAFWNRFNRKSRLPVKCPRVAYSKQMRLASRLN